MTGDLVNLRHDVLAKKAAFAEACVRHADAAVDMARDGKITRDDAVAELEWASHHGHLGHDRMLVRAAARLPVGGTGAMQW